MLFTSKLNQLLNTKESYKALSSIEGRALVYQRLLLTEEPKLKLELIKMLKDIFKTEVAQYHGVMLSKYFLITGNSFCLKEK